MSRATLNRLVGGGALASALAVVLVLSRVAPAVADSAAADLQPATSAQLLGTVHGTGAKVVLVNLWATWCTPCREEFPDLLRFYRAYKDKGVRLLLVSGDFASDTAPAKEFLTSQGVDFPTYIKNEGDEAFINALDSQWTGALPATFVYDAAGKRIHSFLGPITYESLEHEVTPLLAGAT
ncbi:MAG TPA: TlpA disulfide reductase family protein [Candidatus Binatia bacterium]|jgi:thiol-disulfide isomerase/thioredoxin